MKSWLLLLAACSEQGLVAEDTDGAAETDAPDTDPTDTDPADTDPPPCELEVASAGSVSSDETCAAAWTPPSHPWDVDVLWSWPALSSDATVSGVIVPPLVASLTEDDVPDVVFVAYAGYRGLPGWLVAVDGATGAELWARPGFHGFGGTALADVDGDGLVDIIAFDADLHPVAYTADGDLLWRAAAPVRAGFPVATVADLDGDGTAEVLADHVVLDGVTGALELALGTTEDYASTAPIPVDLDLDGRHEIAFGDTVYEADGSARWTVPSEYRHWWAPLQADADADAELLHLGGDRFTVFEPDGTVAVDVPLSLEAPGPPCVADLDGDGRSEVAAAFFTSAGGVLRAFELDGTKLWDAAAFDASGFAACSAADLDGDGAFEVLYGDEFTFTIRDGATGAVRHEEPRHRSQTLSEYPTIVDLDGDASPEILLVSNEPSSADWSGVNVLTHASGGWAHTGRAWTVPDYAPARAPEDGSVPSSPGAWWDDGLFRARPTLDAESPAPDLTVAITDVCVLDAGQVEVAVQVANEGAVEVPAGALVALYTGDAGALTLIATTALEAVPSGRALDGLTFSFPAADLGPDGLIARVDDDGTGVGVHPDCDPTDDEARWDDEP